MEPFDEFDEFDANHEPEAPTPPAEESPVAPVKTDKTTEPVDEVNLVVASFGVDSLVVFDPSGELDEHGAETKYEILREPTAVPAALADYIIDRGLRSGVLITVVKGDDDETESE